MKPLLRKLNLTSHISFSIGWSGAVVVFLALAIVGLRSSNPFTVRSAYGAMQISAAYVIMPLCFASLITGIIQALGTKWGLFRYYWVAVKLFTTVFISVLLLLHMQPIAYLAGLAAESNIGNDQEYGRRIQMIADAGAAIIALLFITGISIFKPWGLIKKRRSETSASVTNGNSGRLGKPAGFYILIALAIIVMIIILKHLFGGGMNHH